MSQGQICRGRRKGNETGSRQCRKDKYAEAVARTNGVHYGVHFTLWYTFLQYGVHLTLWYTFYVVVYIAHFTLWYTFHHGIHLPYSIDYGIHYGIYYGKVKHFRLWCRKMF